MKKFTKCLLVLSLSLTACNQGGGGGSSATPGGGVVKGNSGEVAEWQSAALGQEGHGGDAIVCFRIPIESALYQINTKPDNNTCAPGGSCSDGQSSVSPTDPNSPSSGIIWRMTDAGRKAIQSAKPLEQYLGERIASKKVIIDQLNQMSLQDGYEKILAPFTKLPSAFSRISEMHRKLGWLNEDGISSEYGLMYINDSGFVNENEIDKTHCKELQAVVRRDNQLWYDADIVSHFDNAGRVLIQLHEEIYTWGKAQDKINWEVPGQPAHETSTKTRRLILKILDPGMDEKLVNENLKALGFSTMYWETQFNVPTVVGFHMDADSCMAEQQYLKSFFEACSGDLDFQLQAERLFSNRYLKSSRAEPILQLRNNYPDALSNMIAFTMGNEHFATSEIMKLQEIFKRPESCQGRF